MRNNVIMADMPMYGSHKKLLSRFYTNIWPQGIRVSVWGSNQVDVLQNIKLSLLSVIL